MRSKNTMTNDVLLEIKKFHRLKQLKEDLKELGLLGKVKTTLDEIKKEEEEKDKETILKSIGTEIPLSRFIRFPKEDTLL
jgi:hypothetical protein